ncbi:tetratricopeptide repeat protein [Thiorhodococcus fuscus]|uniref:Tetratricopeptide repeat protein n=1 Tax=Thiorhodococcus fuscus TaxID=527200 RepID=A0ABW4YB36_9GAMM
MHPDRRLPALIIAAITLTALTYWPAIDAQYVWDDWQLFANNPALRVPKLFWQALFEPILPGTAYIRPVTLASFALEFWLSGVNSAISHAVNISLHLANSLLVGLIAIRLTANREFKARAWRVLLATLVYSLHPALIEPVTWISGRFDLLVTFFVLLAVWGYLAIDGWRRDLWVTICFLFAALSKEMAATLPALLLLLYLGQQGSLTPWRTLIISFFRSREWRLYSLLAATAALILMLRYALLGQITSRDQGVNAGFEDIWHHIGFVGQTLLFYAKMSLWPFTDINPQHPFNAINMSHSAHLIGISLAIIGILTFGFLIRSRRWPAILLACWGISLLPVINILPLPIGGSIGHERFLTMPLAFLALSAATLHFKFIELSPSMHRSLPIFAGVLSLLVIIAAIANIRITIPLWNNELSLWAWADSRNPSVPAIQNNYAASALRFNDISRAELILEKLDAFYAINHNRTLERQYAITKLLKGEYYLKKNQPEKALASFRDALEMSPAPPHQFIQSMGISELDIESIDGFDAAFFYRSIYTDFATANLMLGKFTEAFSDARTVLMYAPTYPNGWLLKALSLYGLDRWKEAEASFAQASDYFIPDGKLDAQSRRTQVLSQICTLPMSPKDVCAHWETELERAKP